MFISYKFQRKSEVVSVKFVKQAIYSSLQIIIKLSKMSCHFSCGTCTSTLFTSCLTCPSSSSLINGACFCSSSWDSLCTYTTNLQQVYAALKPFYTLIAVLVMFLYCLKVKLPYSYRIVVGMQSLGLLVFSTQIYLYYENEFGLRMLAATNGFYNFSSRLQSFDFNYAMPPIVLFGCFALGLFSMYYPANTFIKSYQGFTQYLGDNCWHFLSTFYYFSSRMMFYYIGLWINSLSTTITLIVPFSIFSLIICMVIIKLIYHYHKHKLQQDHVYEPELYLYTMLSGVPMVGLPFVQNSTMYFIIYLVQIGLLVLLAILNRNYEVFTKEKIIFYLVQILISGFIVAIVMIPDPYRSYVLLITILLATLAMIFQMATLYYSGVNLVRSAKVHPQNGESQPIKSIKQASQNPRRLTKISTQKKNYF